MIRRRIRITGIVQGVGFRPFVYREAIHAGLHGWVKNDSDCVQAEVAGSKEIVNFFTKRLKDHAPRSSRIAGFSYEDHPLSEKEFIEYSKEYCGFSILESSGTDSSVLFIPADLSVCPQCLSEMNDPSDRRYRYPFINCTDCGPRFTVIQTLPYDRKHTTMHEFEMCSECRNEYTDLKSRRFHAEPIACPACGPSLLFINKNEVIFLEKWLESLQTDNLPSLKPGAFLEAAADAGITRTEDPIDAAVRILKEGGILALKGLGGYQLVCDACSEETVRRLRLRKNRYRKPFAVMFAETEIIKNYTFLSEESEKLLKSAASPIVIVPDRTTVKPLAPSVHPGLKETGVMLPVTPLHHLLSVLFGGPLIVTSGNLSDEPICISDLDAARKLKNIADCFLMNNRRIHTAADDSVFRQDLNGSCFPVRLSRGYSPFVIPLRGPAQDSHTVLAAGSDLKNAPALLHADAVITGAHCGDLASPESFRSFIHNINKLINITKSEPRSAVCDMHPDYVSSRWVQSVYEKDKIMQVQHHHAHIVSVLAEYGIPGPVLGIALDGTGYGPDGIIRGFEILHADETDYRRLGRLLPFPLPGGDLAVKETWRTALSLLHAAEKYTEKKAEHKKIQYFKNLYIHSLLEDFPEAEHVMNLTASGFPFPAAASCGRLFDGVAALMSRAFRTSHYEGQTAMEMESLIPEISVQADVYPFPLVLNPKPDPDRYSGFLFEFDFRPLIAALIQDITDGPDETLISVKFHNTLAAAITESAKLSRDLTLENTVALSGGTFQNRYLRKVLAENLEKEGFRVLLPVTLPCGDGGLAPGQAVAALNKIKGKKSCV